MPLDLEAIRADLDALEAQGCEYAVLRSLQDAIQLDKGLEAPSKEGER